MITHYTHTHTVYIYNTLLSQTACGLNGLVSINYESLYSAWINVFTKNIQNAVSFVLFLLLYTKSWPRHREAELHFLEALARFIRIQINIDFYCFWKYSWPCTTVSTKTRRHVHTHTHTEEPIYMDRASLFCGQPVRILTLKRSPPVQFLKRSIMSSSHSTDKENN